MRALVLACLFIVALTPCSQAQEGKHRTSIPIATTLTKDEAYQRATAALIEAGYAIEDANQVAITTSRRTFKNVWDLQVRVNVLGIGDSTRLLVTGTYWVTCCGMLKQDNRQVESDRSGVAGRMWKELELAAEAVRRAVASDASVAGTAR